MADSSPVSQQIQVCVNGTEHQVKGDCRLTDLLRQLEINQPAIAVELNTEILPKSEFATCQLRDGDVLEIVTLVGGG